MTEVKETIIRNLKEACRIRDIKNKDIAEFLGVSQGSVTNWFKGTNFIDVDNLYKLCVHLGITLDQVFGVAPMVSESLSPSERAIILAYRKAETGRQESVRVLLGVPEEKKYIEQSAT